MKYRPVGQRLMDMAAPRPNGCWEWTGHIRGRGYGGIQVGRKTFMAHRVAYELFVGPIPDGLELDHLCGNRKCVNPQHLEPVTRLENIRRSQNKTAMPLRTGRCHRGHLFAGENIYVRPDGDRRCRPCQQVTSADRARRRAAA